MAREAYPFYLKNSDGFQVMMTVADGAAITKGTPLTLSDPKTVAAVSATGTIAGYVFGGIAAADKVASDGATQLTVWTEGDFVVTASGAITVGQPIKSCGTNYFMAALYYDVASGAIAGYALETAADKETFVARLRA